MCRVLECLFRTADDSELYSPFVHAKLRHSYVYTHLTEYVQILTMRVTKLKQDKDASAKQLHSTPRRSQRRNCVLSIRDRPAEVTYTQERRTDAIHPPTQNYISQVCVYTRKLSYVRP